MSVQAAAAAAGAMRPGARQPAPLVPDYDRFDMETPGEEAPLRRTVRPKSKGIGPVTWLALITLLIVGASLLDSRHRSVRAARPCARHALASGGWPRHEWGRMRTRVCGVRARRG